MPLALLGLGANLGDRAAALNAAIEALSDARGIAVIRRSAVIETSPVGGPADQPLYLNAAVVVETQLSPESLLAKLHEIEASLGRHRDVHWGSRTIDLDLLLYDQQVVESPTLTIPHPRMSFRRFVLEPAVEVGGDWQHPISKTTLLELLATLHAKAPYIAIDAGVSNLDVSNLGEPEASSPGAVASRLAHDVAQLSMARTITLPHPPDDVRMAISAGRALQVAVEFLAAFRNRLDASSWPEPRRPAISDFWIDRVEWQIASWLSAGERTTFEREWRQAQVGMRSPTLLVLRSGATWPSFRGSMLRLSSTDHDDQCREVTAAMQAMR